MALATTALTLAGLAVDAGVADAGGPGDGCDYSTTVSHAQYLYLGDTYVGRVDLVYSPVPRALQGSAPERTPVHAGRDADRGVEVLPQGGAGAEAGDLGGELQGVNATKTATTPSADDLLINRPGRPLDPGCA
ncbi:hypothetical protein [Kitasatospora sp. MAP5-34]|uniref:hypothetical protein n=1 Tax=Kitasatospora sp. MAP5-34 TaxID=3035102 RepID=UPI00247663EF|nr:hypothetical protein [Kitasatospora sp. MAP5-34]MDH6577259.1 hypothetical protein [Kitasatospora sp. MAP5-34]